MNTPRRLIRALRILRAQGLTAMVLVASSFLLSSAFATDPTGDLFVASFLTGNVTRLDGATGSVVYSVHQSPATINLAKGPDGDLYVSTLFASTVVKTDTETGAPLGT